MKILVVTFLTFKSSYFIYGNAVSLFGLDFVVILFVYAVELVAIVTG